MRRDARALVIADGAGLLLAALGLALVRTPHITAMAREHVPHLPWPVPAAVATALLLTAAHRRRRSRANTSERQVGHTRGRCRALTRRHPHDKSCPSPRRASDAVGSRRPSGIVDASRWTPRHDMLAHPQS
jgi:hypothetical protein